MTCYSGSSNSTDESEEHICMMEKFQKSNTRERDDESYNKNMLIYTFVYST